MDAPFYPPFNSSIQGSAALTQLLSTVTAPTPVPAITQAALGQQVEEKKFSPLATFMIKRIEACSTQHLIIIAREISRWSWTPIEQSHVDKYLAKLHQATQQEILAFNCDEVARVSWFLLQAKPHDRAEKSLQEDVKKTFNHFAKKHLNKLIDEEFVDIACALDDLDYREEDLFKKLSLKIQASFKNFKPQHFAWAAFAFRKVKPLDIELFKILCKNAPVHKFIASHIGFMAKALAQAGFRNPRIFDELSYQVIKEEQYFNANDIAHTLWGYAYMYTHVKWKREDEIFVQEFNERILEPLKNATIEKIYELNPKNLTRVVWAFESLSCTDQQLFDVLVKRLIEEMPHFTLPEIANLIKSLFCVGCAKENVLSLLLEKAETNLKDFDQEQIVKIAGGLTVGYCSSYAINIERYIKIFLDEIFKLNALVENRALRPWKDEELSHINTIYKLYFFKLKARQSSPESLEKSEPKKCQPLPESLEKEIANYLKKLKPEKKEPISSEFHKKIAAVLEQVKEGFENEYPFESFFLDIAYPAEKIAGEVDGQTHFGKNSEKYREKNKVKNTLLELEGWKLFRVPYFEWNKEKGLENQKKYLREKLDELNKQKSKNSNSK